MSPNKNKSLNCNFWFKFSLIFSMYSTPIISRFLGLFVSLSTNIKNPYLVNWSFFLLKNVFFLSCEFIYLFCHALFTSFFQLFALSCFSQRNNFMLSIRFTQNTDLTIVQIVLFFRALIFTASILKALSWKY